MQEKPLFSIPKLHHKITEEEVWAAFLKLGSIEKSRFLGLRYKGLEPFTSMRCVFSDNTSLPHDKHPPAEGFFILSSRFNHSCCFVNATVGGNGKGTPHSLTTTRDIEAGEEITFSHHPASECRPALERHQRLGFVCKCKACLPDTLFQQLSDMRRRLLRGLKYLIYGADLDGKKQNSTSPIIFEAKLKRDAEDSSIPISSMFICYILAMFLLEQEGLLDQFLLQEMVPRILQLATILMTEENRRIALLATQQETWFPRFCVAFKLYGRGDPADRGFAERLGMFKRCPGLRKAW